MQPRSDGIAGAAQLLFRLAGGVSPEATRVRTTIDRDLQAFAENATQQVVGSLIERRVRDGAAIVIDNRDGAILAYVGSADYFARTGAGKNDGVTALRQPGSTLKPFLYELAFERRVVRPTTILADVPTTYAIPSARVQPGDYSERFAGPVRPRIALADSLNVPAVRVLSEVGVPSFLERLRALGFEHLTRDADHYGLGLALGGGEVSLEELAGAYATIANGGRRVRVHAVAEAPGAPRGAARVGAASEWALVTDILADAHARARAFGVASLLRTPFASAVKTGTSSDFRDTWTIGFTRDYTVAVWVGNFDGSPMQRVSGVTGAAPPVEPAGAAPGRAQYAGGVRGAARVRAPLDVRDDRRAADARLPQRRRRMARRARSHRLAGAARTLDRTYDAWLAAQPPQTTEALRIVAPHDGDVFVAAPGARIAVVARGTHRPSWDLNGRAVAAHEARWTLALARGRWTLRARDAGRADAVTFTVGDPLPRARRAGFTIRD